MAHVQVTSAALSADGKRVVKNVVERFTVAQPLSQNDGLAFQLRVGHRPVGFFQFRDRFGTFTVA